MIDFEARMLTYDRMHVLNNLAEGLDILTKQNEYQQLFGLI